MPRSKPYDVIRDFDELPDSMLVDIGIACTVLDRSRSSIYRHFQAGELKKVKVGSATKTTVGGLRRLSRA